MATFIAAFLFLLVFFLLMSVGYLIKRKAVQGSCGGLGALGIEKACDCDEPCDRRKARDAKERERQEKLAKHRII
ncbi:(Na+)-NQR maturation NqrM [Shewanella sp. A3A]|uniref:(Na+)-NQR maturation NqrM n=1 Tax=Shewanella electrica TaxID=515560 RepID=A0ABT2FFX2_9GAMM|nr:(Na+)-NQR maturation NqrM [Shewanella electrica]MCH1918560.1 (Na+)-NQR maturation NqrM [Shewanella ferrihydritica]MCH1925288.1 (Na+)-NQR maturation NqrM [Shewanella electrica]MCS4555113.1 (Na+)-NQR maturation NqrM [Shewanella electrica]